MKLLLHCCCAPCSISCVTNLRAENITPFIFWFNPNIHPDTEYESRKNCLYKYASNENLELLQEPNTDEHICCYSSIEHRCLKCYQIRLEKTAAIAAKENFSAFTTTLLISPYQDHELIKQTGENISAKYGIEFLYRDFRPLFREGQAAARKSGMYMQKYCGCSLSKNEALTKKREKK